MKIKFNKAFLLCLAACPLLFMSENTFAACSWDNNGPKKVITSDVTFGNVIVQRDTPIGSVIASTTSGDFFGGKPLFSCTEEWTASHEPMLYTTLSSYGNKVFNTNIAGVGIRVSGVSQAVPFTSSYLSTQSITLGPRTVELIKTSSGGVGSGNLTVGDISQTYAQPDSSYKALVALRGTNTIIPVACSVNNTVINVSLDDAAVADFKGVGSTAKPKDFNIGLNCDAGTNVKLTLDGNSAGPAGVLSLNAGEHQASGIGIQVLNGTTPVVLGNQLDLGTAGKTGDMQIPLVAQYYQTDASIIAGLTNATATFTMVYN
ncbi:fimbrial protein [Ewingella americana]|uniref:Fimbrial adhesin n=2 Tax=Ewingella americana TaxID=41202 RepID=A0A085GLY6_EWIA3|nr:fimbrial protein [Ewingella americana]KAA8728789.1 fimbrial protein [Ewingella americana]KFC84731.1 fimbrial adhesin [Ewingella americana ATCC 33852]STQ45919.1 putative major fimbrial protein SthE [Ewingella americana]